MKYMLTDHWGGKFYNAKKTASNTEDDLMCWAAAASNVLAWTNWGSPPSQNFIDEVSIFQYFQNHWIDNVGSPQYAWEWWFNGKDYDNVDVPGGGFWKESPYSFDTYYHVEWDRTHALTAIDNFLHSGYAVVLSLISQNGGHDITCWGYEYDENNGEYLGIYVTDSDDMQVEPRYYQLSKDGWASYDGWWYIQYYKNSIEYLISTVHAMDRYIIPPKPPLSVTID